MENRDRITGHVRGAEWPSLHRLSTHLCSYSNIAEMAASPQLDYLSSVQEAGNGEPGRVLASGKEPLQLWGFFPPFPFLFSFGFN